jgi:uncharacterized protein YaeQ
MALRSTVYKAALQRADIDRGRYDDHALTLALHPSETEERLMVRLLAYALNAPADDAEGALQFARGLSDTDEPDLWRHDLGGRLVDWIEVGQPDERRLAKACGRADRVTIYCYAASAPIWWSGVAPKASRLANLEVWRLDAAQSKALAELAARSMQLQVTVHDGVVSVGDAKRHVELHPERLHGKGD